MTVNGMASINSKPDFVINFTTREAWLPCGRCEMPRRHRFVEKRRMAIGIECVYACECGEHRRWGLE